MSTEGVISSACGRGREVGRKSVSECIEMEGEREGGRRKRMYVCIGKEKG